MTPEERAQKLIATYKRSIDYPPPGLWAFERELAQALRECRIDALDEAASLVDPLVDATPVGWEEIAECCDKIHALKEGDTSKEGEQ